MSKCEIEQQIEALRLEFRTGCLLCGSTKNLRRCAGCQAVFYCSAEHQKQDWKTSHRSQCTTIKAERLAVDTSEGTEMTAEKCRQFVLESQRLVNLSRAPNLSPQKRLDKALRAKELCMRVIICPEHLDMSLGDFVSDAIMNHVQCFVEVNLLANNIEACKAVVDQTLRMLNAYSVYCLGGSEEAREHVESIPEFTDFIAAETRARISNHEKKYDEEMVHLERCIEVSRVLLQDCSPEATTIMNEFRGHLTRVYRAMVLCASSMKDFDKMEQYSKLAQENCNDPSQRLMLQFEYIAVLEGQTESIRENALVLMENYRKDLMEYEDLIERMQANTVIVEKNSAICRTMVPAIAQDAIRLNSFLTWSSATSLLCRHWFAAGPQFKEEADKLATLVIKMHSCTSNACADVVFSRQVLNACDPRDIDDDEIDKAPDACKTTSRKEWNQYRS
ncbi:hypothetical protein BDR26DRAFT_1003332 [Obelidium mucronatum]|nr:hypothetical protein BDR26DRAFT_1003332 [Obelidium mucronatum]